MPKEGICIPPKSEDIILVLELELEDEEKDEDCIDEPMFIPPIFMFPMFMFPIILLIISSMPRLGICMPPPNMLPMGGIPPIVGMLPPDIMVEEEEDELLDLKLEIVEPSGD